MPRWSKKPPLEPEVSPSLPGLCLDWDSEVLGGVNLWQFAALAGLLVVFCGLLCYWQRRADTWARLKDKNDPEKSIIKCDLHMGAMHKCVYFKEVFWNYLCAAMLEPLLSIVDQDATSKSLVANGLQLFGLLWWIYNLHDAFDSSDTTQVHKFLNSGLGFDWLKLPQDDQQKEKRKERARKDLAGKVVRDLALYYMVLNIACAELGIFTRRQVVHSYCVVIFWVFLHHAATRATVWLEGGFTAKNYLLTLCSPSVTLQPFEYCLPFDEVEKPQAWHEFVKDTCGVSLTVYTACLPGAAVSQS